FTLEVDGLPPDAFVVVSFHLSQSLSSVFSLELSLVSQQFLSLVSQQFLSLVSQQFLSLVSQQFLSLDFPQMLEKMAYLTIWQGNDAQRRVKGVVTWF
ncbi:hypothetical protein C7B09_26380, partial [Escherichia albertii]